MKRVIVLLLMAALLSGSAGCTVVQETQTFAESFPDKYWENVWVIEERKTDILFDTDLVVMDGYCRIHYQGDQIAEDVAILIRSPLTYKFIGGGNAWHYSTVQPGQELEYIMHKEYENWHKNVPPYIFADKLQDDYKENAYVGISWRYGDQTYSKKFFDWHKEKY